MLNFFRSPKRDERQPRQDDRPSHAAPERHHLSNLEATVERLPDGWSVRLPVRADQVTCEKRTVVVEEVGVRVEHAPDVRTVRDTVRHEELVVDADRDVRLDYDDPATRDLDRHYEATQPVRRD